MEDEYGNIDDAGTDTPAPRLSLSQLIYSQSSQPSDAQDVTQKKRKKDEEKTVKPATRKTRKRSSASRRKIFDMNDSDEDEDEVETQSQAEARERREAENKRHVMITEAWRNRKLDMREEEDVNGAYELLVRKNFDKIKHMDFVNNDESDGKEEEDDFWEMGLCAPAHKEKGSLVSLKASDFVIQKEDLPTDEEASERLPSYFTMTRKKEIEARHFFPFPQATNTLGSSIHFHRGALGRLAIQYLISCHGGADEIIENKLLKLLFQMENNSRFKALLAQARLRAREVETFLSYEWKDRAEASKQLNVGFKANNIFYDAGFTSTETDRIKSAENYHLRSIIDRLSKSKLDKSEDKRGFVQNYGHRSGFVPPEPLGFSDEFDDLKITFGGEDSNNQAVLTSKIHPSAPHLLLSTLISRLASAQNMGDKNTMKKIDGDIMATLTLIVKENQYDIQRKIGFDSEAPVVCEYESLMMLCTYIANSADLDSGMLEDVCHRPDFPRGKDNAHDEIEEFPFNNKKRAAEELCRLLCKARTGSGVNIFPRIHLIYALCRIVEDLPLEAVDVLAVTEDNPIIAIKELLHFLEDKKMLIETGDTSDDKVLVALLEYSFFKAAEIIKPISLSPNTDIDYSAWLVALRLGSLLLKSGIKIGQSAVLHPSYKVNEENMNDLFSQEQETTHLPHEIRERLPKFEETRLQAAEATLALFEKADDIGCGRGSAFITSILEWSQAVALLAGPGKKAVPLNVDSRWKLIQALYARHIIKLKPRQLQDHKVHEKLDRNMIVDSLALAFEKEPENIYCWRRLVRELGPVGIPVKYRNPVEVKQCESCDECKFLRAGFQVNHGNKQEKSWWGHQRKSWWLPHVLRNSRERILSSKERTVELNSKELSSVLEKLMELNESIPSTEYAASPSFASDNVHKLSRDRLFTWLRRIIKCSKKEKVNKGDHQNKKIDVVKIPSLESRNILVNDMLPVSCDESHITEQDLVENSFEAKVVQVSDKEPALEIQCYKVLITAHLYGANHMAVAEGVRYLAHVMENNAHSMNEMKILRIKRDARECLRWLFIHGLDTVRLVQHNLL